MKWPHFWPIFDQKYLEFRLKIEIREILNFLHKLILFPPVFDLKISSFENANRGVALLIFFNKPDMYAYSYSVIGFNSEADFYYEQNEHRNEADRSLRFIGFENSV